MQSKTRARCIASRRGREPTSPTRPTCSGWRHSCSRVAGTQQEAIAALFHDSLEDTSMTPKQIRRRYGRKVASIVDRVHRRPCRQDREAEEAAARRIHLARAEAAFARAPARPGRIGLGTARPRGRRALQRAHHPRRPAALRPRDVGTLQRRCGRPTLVLPVVVDRALRATPRPAQRRAARHGARDGEPGRLVVRPRRPPTRALNEEAGAPTRQGEIG